MWIMYPSGDKSIVALEWAVYAPVVAANVFLGFSAAAPHSGYWAIGSFFWAALYIAFFIRIIRAPLPRKENTTRIRDALKHFQMI